MLSIFEAADLLRKGELIAFPTETVYGLGAPIFSPDSIRAIFSVKGRPQDNPLIAHVAHIDQCKELARELPPLFYPLAMAFFPGPLTLVLRKNSKVSDLVTAGLETIAVRMPNHPIATELILTVGEPLVAPSANLSGRPSSTTAEHVLRDFEGKIGGVIDGGPCLHGLESTVLDLVSFERPTILRPGVLKKEAIEAVLGMEIDVYKSGPRSSPGMKYRHYAPNIPVQFFSDKNAFEKHLSKGKNPFVLTSVESKTFYSSLRYAEENGYDEVVIFCVEPIDAALQNRLEKITDESRRN